MVIRKQIHLLKLHCLFSNLCCGDILNIDQAVADKTVLDRGMIQHLPIAGDKILRPFQGNPHLFEHLKINAAVTSGI